MERNAGQLVELPLTFSRKRDSYIFQLNCKNAGRDFTYDFSDLGERYPSIVSAFITAIIATRHLVGHSRRKFLKRAITSFLQYLDTIQFATGKTIEFEHINAIMLSNFAAWSKQSPTENQLTQSYRVYALQPLITWLRRNHPDANPDLVFERNLFPMAHRAKEPRKPYSPKEWNDLLKAIAAEIKESKRRLETTYIFQWKGKAPPLEDVAPFDENSPSPKQHSIWESDEYMIWWWETNTACMRVNDYALRRDIRGASSFLTAVAERARTGKFGARTSGLSYVDMFYDWVGAGPNYVPRFQDSPCPIKYQNRFRKPEYLDWYWENLLNASALDLDALKTGGHYRFLSGVIALFGGTTKFYDSKNLKRRLTYADLLPYVLLLAVRTALNPSVIAKLTIDCIRPAPSIQNPNLEEPEHWHIDWEKIRSFSRGATIPTHVRHDLMPVSVILRVIKITAPHRTNSKRLWITETGDEMITLAAEIASFVKRHDLKELDADGNEKPFALQIARIRPTIAMREYVRTENMAYIQTLLGHRSMGMTVQYISQMDNPILMSRRGVHQDAMFLDLTGNGELAVQLLEAHGMGADAAKALADIESEHHGLLTSCKNPRNSPQPGQSAGKICKSDACLSCQNLVVTNRDLHKYFCFIRYHDSMRDTGRMPSLDYDLATAEVKHMFENYVLPKFRPQTVEIARTQAIEYPLPEWKCEVKA